MGCSNLLGVNYEYVLKVSIHSWLLLSDLLAGNYSHCNLRLRVLDRRFKPPVHSMISHVNTAVACVFLGDGVGRATIPASAARVVRDPTFRFKEIAQRAAESGLKMWRSNC